MFALNKHLFVGIVFTAPFFVLNALVMSGTPILKVLRPESHTTAYEQILVFVLIFLTGVGGIVSLYPVIKGRRLLVLNILVGALLIGFSVMAGYGLGVDIYHCDILRIPNCD